MDERRTVKKLSSWDGGGESVANMVQPSISDAVVRPLP
jgi:hypothetical protein